MDKILYDYGLAKRRPVLRDDEEMRRSSERIRTDNPRWRRSEIRWSRFRCRAPDPVMLFYYPSLRILPAIGVSPDSRRGLP